MQLQKVISFASKGFVGFSILSIGYVSVLSLLDPKATMELVNVTLSNTDAVSSIRGIYGGVGLVITLSLVYLLLKNLRQGLIFLGMFWGAYAASRIVTWVADGPLGAFGSQWLVIESVFFGLAVVLALLNREKSWTNAA